MRYSIILCILLISACGTAPTSKYKIFNMNQVAGIESLDPAFAKNLFIMWQTNQLYNRLVESGADGKMQPSLAKSWSISADRKTYTFQIRKDVYFHDNKVFENGKGRRMNANDVVYSFSRIIDAGTASPGAWIFNGHVDSTKPFEAPNDSTFIMHLIQPFNPMLNILSMQYCGIVPHESIEQYGKDFRSNPCGTGPFMMEHWDEGNVLTLIKNKNYWERDSNGKQLPLIDGVKVTFVDSKASEFLMFTSGRIDFMNGIDASFKDEVLTKQGALKESFNNKINLNKAEYLNIEYLGMLVEDGNANANKALLQKPIRRAISCGFDKQKLVTYIRNNVGTAAQAGMIHKNLKGFDTAIQKKTLYNPKQAKALLAGKTIQETITIFTADNNEDKCSFVANQLIDIGLKVKVEVMQPALLREQISQSKIQMWYGVWLADYPDAESYLSIFYGKNTAPPNYSRFKNATYDKLYEQAMQEQDPNTLTTLYKKLDAIIMDEIPYIPLFYDQVLHFTQPRVRNWQSTNLNILQLKNIDIIIEK
jgi:oligopeptide transport system substrate-binding protein